MNRSSLLALLLLLGFGLRGLIPVGWMPVISHDGITLTWCSGDVPQPAPEAVHANHHAGSADYGSHHPPAEPPQTPQHKGEASSAICAFAAMAADLPAIAAAPSQTELPALVERPAFAPAAVARTLAAPPPPATGPPTLI